MSKEAQERERLSSKSVKKEGSFTLNGVSVGHRGQNAMSQVLGSPSEEDKLRLAVLEGQLQLLQKRVSDTISSEVKLRHLLSQQEREREEWRQSRRSLERQLGEERESRDRLRRSEERTGSRRSLERQLMEEKGIRGKMRSRSGEEEEDWGSRRSLERRLAEEKELREKLRRSPLEDMRWSTGGGEESGELGSSVLYRTSSSQSLPANSFDDHTHLSPPSSLRNYPISSRPKPKSYQLTPPYAAEPLSNSSSLNHSTSSLSSHKSTQSARDHTYRDHTHHRSYLPSSRHKVPSSYLTEQHARSHHHWSRDLLNLHARKGGVSDHLTAKSVGVNGSISAGAVKPLLYVSRSRQHSASSSRASSVRGSPPEEEDVANETMVSPNVELERAKLKIKKLEREVSVLEKLLGDKTRSTRRYVEELMSIRTQLAQEKASLAIVRQEAQDEADRKVGVAKSTHAQRSGEMEAQLRRAGEEKRRVESQLASLRHELLSKESEGGRLQAEMLALKREVKDEKACRSKAMAELQVELQESNFQVAQLEKSLRAKKVELEGVVTKSNRESTHHKADMKQAKKQIESLSEQLKEKMEDLAKTSETTAQLQQDLEGVRVELQKNHASWKYSDKMLTERLRECEAARDSLLHQLAEASQRLNVRSARSREEEEEIATELARYRSEVQRLVGAVKSEQVSRSLFEGEVDRLKEEVRKAEGEARDTVLRLKEGERKVEVDRERVEECEEEGRSLREEVGRLSEELRRSQRRLQEELERKAEKEKEGEETLTRLQQELVKRAQKVLEMDRLLQTHQSDTTARRLQLERNLTRMEGEVKGRTREVEQLTAQAAGDRATIQDLRDQLDQFKENQMSLFSGSQAQLINKDSKLAELNAQLKSAQSALREREAEVARLGAGLEGVEEKRKAREVRCRELEGQLETLTLDNKALRVAHQSEVERLVEMHACQLSSREEQVSTHREQLQQFTSQDKTRVQELSRYRTQVTSLSAELCAERRVSEEAQRDALQARMESEQWRSEVSDLKKSLSAMQTEALSLHAPAATTHWTTPTNSWDPTPQSLTTPFNSAPSANGLNTPNHHHSTVVSSATPTSMVTTPTPKGSIFNV